MPKSSLVIAHYPYSDEINDFFDQCRNSIQGYDEMIVIVNDGIGYGKSYNWGMKVSKGDFIVCVSNDAKLLEGRIEMLFDPDHITTPSLETGGVQWGAFFCLPRHIYQEIGGFDEDLEGAYFEDDDLMLRWKIKGYTVKEVPTVKISHIGGKTVKDMGKEREWYSANQAKFIAKWGGTPDQVNRYYDVHGRLP